MPVEMQPIDSRLISHRGFDPAKHIMFLRFRKKDGPGSLYQYGNISPEFWDKLCTHKNSEGELSFGQAFGLFVKKETERYPFRKIDEASETPTIDFDGPTVKEVLQASVAETTDFASGQPLPVAPDSDIVIPTDEPQLRVAAQELATKASALAPAGARIIISTADEYTRLGTMVMAVVKMRKGISETYDPVIAEKHKAHKDALADKNLLDQPLASFERQADQAMANYRQAELDRVRRENENARAEEKRLAEEDAKRRADDLKLSDVTEALNRGEDDVAEQIFAAPALPLAPIHSAPARMVAEIPKIAGISVREDVDFEIENEALIPEAFMMRVPDLKTIAAKVASMGLRTDIAGVRVFPVSRQAKSRKKA